MNIVMEKLIGLNPDFSFWVRNRGGQREGDMDGDRGTGVTLVVTPQRSELKSGTLVLAY